MKRIWLKLLVVLTACILSVCGATAEAQPEFAAPMDEAVPEAEEFALGGDELLPDEPVGGSDGVWQDAVETTVLSPEAAPMASVPEDFYIVDGVLLKYIGQGGDVVIPDGVTSIAKEAFYGFETINSVVVPQGVTAIGESTFAFCTHMQSVALPEGLTEIDKYAFECCESLIGISLPSTLTYLGTDAFNACEKLKRIDIPEGISSISDYAFYGCAELEEITFPSTLVEIGEGAFCRCFSLKQPVLPQSLQSIGPNAFGDCWAFEAVTIPASVSFIGEYAFNDWRYWHEDEIYKPLNIVIATPCGSYAQGWANENGIPVSITEHAPTTDYGYAPSCTENGLTEGSHCAKCETVLVAQQPIPATGHTVVTDAGYAPSCDKNGLTEGSHCSVCNAVLVAQQHIPGPGHTPVYDAGYAPGYGVNGLTEGSHCAVCGMVLVPQQPIPALTIPQIVLSKEKDNGYMTANVGGQCVIVPEFAQTQGWTVSGYKSSKPAVASVDANGLVVAVAEGKAKITVTTANKKKATFTVQVADPYKPTGVSIVQGKSITLNVGQPVQLFVTLAPETARATLTWKSSKTKVATVDAGGVVTPLAEGKAKITVTTQNKKKAAITVTVVDPNKPLGIAIAQGKAITLKMGEGVQLLPEMSPATAQSALTWKSSKPAVAAVDTNGFVAALKKGKAKITVMTYNKKKATITVNVVE
ncbi:MAG: leucine-rich repeat protein [Clostridia bacterium]|nr:leucine-rich repeat protein [Clostridia bacterium]